MIDPNKLDKFLSQQDIDKFEGLLKLQKDVNSTDPVLIIALDLLHQIKASIVHEDEHCFMLRKNTLIQPYKG